MDNKQGIRLWIKALPLAFAAVLLLSGCEALRVYVKESAGASGTPAVVSEAPEYVPGTELPEPLLYEASGEVFMACGNDVMSLGKADDLVVEDAFNAALSEDKKYLYYIDYGGQEGAGALMKAAADLPGGLETVAEGVCAAQVFGDGESIMYITGIQDMTGDLYVMSGGKTELIASGVLPVEYGFSTGGECLYYTVQEEAGNIGLYIKKSGAAPSLVGEYPATPYISYGVCLDELTVYAADDEGRLLYSLGSEYETGKLMLYSDGESETISESGKAIVAFSPDEFIYTETPVGDPYSWSTSLNYKAPGSEPETLSDNGFPVFAGDYYSYNNIAGEESDRNFLIAEQVVDNGGYNQSATLYEQQLGKEKTVVAQSDGFAYQLSPAGNCVIYGRDNKTYVSRKTDGGWTEQELSAYQQTLMGVSGFDASGTYYYYIELDGYTMGGTLNRYCVADGKTEQLAQNISSFYVIGDAPYAIGTDKYVYRFEGNTAVGTDGRADFIVESRGGVYLETYTDEQAQDDGEYIYDISFLGEGANTTQPICSDATEMYVFSVEFYPPIAKDPARAIESIIAEAYYYQSVLEDESSSYESSMTLEEATAIAKTLSGTSDSYYLELYTNLYDGFNNYGLWQQEKDGDKKEVYRLSALLGFGDAINEYEMNTGD